MCVAQTFCDAIFNKSLPRFLPRDEDHRHCFPVADFFLADVLYPRFERLPDQLPVNRAVHPEWAVASFLRHGFVFALRRVAAIDHEHGQSLYNTELRRISYSKYGRYGAGGGNRTIRAYSFYVTYCKHTNARTAKPAVCPPPMYKIMYNEIGRCGVASSAQVLRRLRKTSKSAFQISLFR